MLFGMDLQFRSESGFAEKHLVTVRPNRQLVVTDSVSELLQNTH
jgi:hypothetical protein